MGRHPRTQWESAPTSHATRAAARLRGPLTARSPQPCANSSFRGIANAQSSPSARFSPPVDGLLSARRARSLAAAASAMGRCTVARYAHPGAAGVLPRSSESSGRYPLPLETDHRSTALHCPEFRPAADSPSACGSPPTGRTVLFCSGFGHFLSGTQGNRSTAPRVNKKTAIRHPEAGHIS
ncbi:hypothetical protein Tfu_1194 [Thermobifida fusca YX]|uniref:Uncharacterized protein n=1 Tax=Thermobifida fusca (strain YX) TaxID=269800 RepID=Q47QN7_THEFY|nr:hypothetical protein Tfu_1194 [Thermobifida fusca YX]